MTEVVTHFETTHSRVLYWLARTPSPPLSPVSPVRTCARIKRPLSEIDPNVMTSREQSPNKRRKMAENLEELFDVHATPRASRIGYQIGKAPTFPISTATPVHSPSSRSNKSQSTKSAASASNRSTSPVKKMADMRLNAQPIIKRQFDDPSVEADLPIELDNMVAIFEKIGRGLGVISEAHSEQIRGVAEKTFRRIDPSSFAISNERAKLGACPSPEQVMKVLRMARDAEEFEHSEAHWNCRIHTPLLDLALDGVPSAGQIGFLNCTTAQIQPKTLIPAGHLGHPVSSKMIDFAIYLQPDTPMFEAMRALSVADTTSLFSVNHTHYAPLRTRPITVNIETKLTGQNWDEAMMQVGIWAAAQFSRLEELVRDKCCNLPFIPIIIVQGHDWNFCAATRGPKQETYIWYKIHFGTTLTALGVYQINMAIQVLAEWTNTFYRTWFKKHILDIE